MTTRWSTIAISRAVELAKQATQRDGMTYIVVQVPTVTRELAYSYLSEADYTVYQQQRGDLIARVTVDSNGESWH